MISSAPNKLIRLNSSNLSTIIPSIVERKKNAAARKRDLVTWCDRKLLIEYGDKKPPKKTEKPLDTLVLTVLSQNTNDVNRDRAHAELKRRYPSWEEVMEAPEKDIAEAIRVGGLSNRKAARIKKMLRQIKKREGRLDLSRVCKMEPREALEYLYSFKGVGEKTAAVVLLFSCGKPLFPVDTHIMRLSKRLGLVQDKGNAKKAHRIMEELVPSEIMYRFHINLIQLGRKICRPRNPECGACCLNKKCPSAFRA